MDYKKKWAELEKSTNPFSIVVRTHLKAIETQWSPKKRLHWKIELFKALHEAKYSKPEILELFRFLDWVLDLPDKETSQFDNFTDEYEDAKKMPYVTSIERIGAARQAQAYVIEVLRIRFKEVHESLVKAIQAIYESSLLSKLHREAVLGNSLEAIEKLVLVAKDSEDNQMPFMSIERRSVLRQLQTSVTDVLRVRFKKVHKSLVKAISAIPNESVLSELHREAILVSSLEAFEKLVNKYDED